MKQIYVFLVAVICLTLSFDAQAQCDYQLELTDFFGNDWDSGANATANAGVDVTIDGVSATYFIVNPSTTPNTPVVEVYTITVNDMSTVDIDYRSTSLPGDGQFRFIDSEGLLVYESPIAQASMMDVYAGVASCPTCLIVTNAVSSSVTANDAVISWTNGGSETEWEVEYGISPYTLGSGGIIDAATTNPFTITGLSSESTYDVYVRAVCVSGTDISNSVGPITFTTPESCPAPSNFVAITQTAFEIQFAWDANGNTSSNYEVNYGVAPYAQGAAGGTTVTGSSGSFAAVDNLMSDTNYNFYVRYDCGMGDFSTWQGAYTAATTISCPVITVLQATVTSSTLDITWTAGGSETQWEVEYAVAGVITAPGTGQGTNATQMAPTSLSLVGLTPDTAYDVFVRAICDAGTNDLSQWVTAAFTTAVSCPAISALQAVATDATLDLTWVAGGSETEWEIEYAVAGVITAPGTGQGTNATQMAPTSLSLSGLTSATAYDVYVRAICDAGTNDLSLWVNATFLVLPSAPNGVSCPNNDSAFAWDDDFETVATNWTGDVGTGATSGDWNFGRNGATGSSGTGPSGAQIGTGYMFFETSGTNTTPAVVVSPAIDLTNATDEAEISFYLHSFGEDGTIVDVAVGTSPTGPFTSVFSYTGQLQTAEADPFVLVGASLPASVLGNATVYIQLTGTEEIGNESGFRGDVAIDLMRIETCGPFCSKPEALVVSNVTTVGVDITFNDTNGTAAGAYEYVIQALGTGVPTTAGTAATSTSITDTSLTPATSYEVYVRTACGGMAGSSEWIGPATFTTNCVTFAAPYFTDFETFTPSTSFTVENCWEANSDSGYNWNVDAAGSTPSSGTGPLAAFSGTSFFYVEASSGVVGDEARLISPLIDISALTAPSIDFKYHMFGAQTGTLHVDVNDGTGWINDVGMIVGQQQTAQADDWLNALIDLAPVTLNGTIIQVRLRAESNGTFAGDISIDDFRVENIPTCPIISMLSSGAASANSADLSWLAGGTEVEWMVEYREVGTAAFTAVSPNPTTTPATTVTGLNSATNYEFCVSAVCGPNDVSRQTCITVETSPDYCAGDLFLDSGGLPDGSGGLQGNYQNNENTTYNICPDNAGDVVFVRFSFTEMEPIGNTGCFDFLTVHDGPDATFPTINTPSGGSEWCWSANGDGTGDLTQEFLIGTTTSGCLTFVFISDSSLSRQGWEASVTCMTAPTCINPDNLALDGRTSTTADVSWTVGATETEWDVEVGLPGFVPDTGAQVGAVFDVLTNPNTTVTGLAADTDYEYWVRAVCAPGDESIYIGPSAFRTRCDAFTAPYVTGYESDPLGGVNSCESRIVSGSTVEVGVANFIANTGIRNMSMESGSAGTAAVAYYILPEFSDLSSDKQVEFQVNDYSGDSLAVGIITNPEDAATFTAVRTFTDADMTDNMYQLETVYFSSLTTVGGFIAFKYIPSGAFNRIFIDDLAYDFAPACPEPSTVRASLITDNSASLEWRENGTATEWEYELDVTGFTQGAGANGIVNTMSNTSSPVSGLIARTVYDFYVRAICSPTSSSTWTGPFTFSTALPTPQGVSCITGAPGYIWEDSFETIATSWTGDVGTGTSNGDWNFGRVGATPSSLTGPGANGAFDGTGYLYFETDGTNVGPASIVSPAIDLTGANDELELSFYLHSYSLFGTDRTQVDIGYGTSASGPFTQVFTYIGQLQANQDDPFQAVGVMLPASLAGQTIYIQITGTEEPGSEFRRFGDVAIDQMRIQTCGAFCVTPSAVTLSAITSDSVIVDWTENGTATTWEVAVETAGTGIPTGNGTSTTNNPYTASGLTPATSYEVYVRADCGGGFFSDWTILQTFSTNCIVIIQYPYVTDFTNNVPNLCWDEAASGEIADGPMGLGTSDWRASRSYENTAAVAVPSNAINLWQNVDREWLLSEIYDMTGTSNDALTVEVAVTSWTGSGASTAANTGVMGSDDQVDLLITTDSGVTWSSLFTWALANQPSATGNSFVFDLSAYTGNVQFAMFASDGIVDDTEDYDFHVGSFVIDGTAGNNDSESFEFNYYPNPTNSLVNFNGQQVIDGLVVRNLLGQQLLVAKPNATSTSIDLSSFPSGLYLVEVVSGDQSRVVKVLRN
jgi:hypothetical protein